MKPQVPVLIHVLRQLVQDGMDKLMKGQNSTFVIAHRLSTDTRTSDVHHGIWNRGVIIERGSHEELMAEKGRYYQLYTG